MNLTWKNVAPAAKAAIEPPGVPSLISTYILDYDPVRGRPLYYFEPNDDARGAELWAFEGGAWKCLTPRRLERAIDHLEGGGWDTTRDGLVALGFAFDSGVRQWVPQGVVLGADGQQRTLTFTGELPLTENDEIEPGTFDARGAFAFDASRKVWVCFTRFGIWELGADDRWSKRKDNADSAIPAEWSNGTGQACFDPVRRQIFFWVQTDSSGYPVLGFAWDGTTLTKVSMKGLPTLLHGLFDPSFTLCGHATQGVVLQVRGKVFGLADDGWKPLAAQGEGPPNMEASIMVHDVKADALFIGPGKHHKKGNDFQRVFFVLADGEWSTHGVVVSPSVLDSAGYSQVRMGHTGGKWVATGTTSLRTWVREGDAWTEVVDDNAGKKVIDELLSLVPGEPLVAISRKGAVAEFTGKGWKALAKASPVYKDRTGAAGARDGNGRVVVWGGEVKNRKSNDTLFLEDGKWRAAKKASPQPPDFKHGKDGVYVGFHLAWDSALGCMVRFGYEEVAALGTDEVWAPLNVKGYTKVITSRSYGHLPAHDRGTGETLLVDLETARVLRFDLAGCVEVARFEYPLELQPKKQHDAAAFHALAETCSYNAASRTLFGASIKNERHVFALDLGPAFDAAKKRGPRKLLGPSKASKPSAPPPLLYRVVKGKLETAKAPKTGFVAAGELDEGAFAAMVGVPSEVVRVGKPQKAKGVLPKSRLGGPAPAVAAKKWPGKKGRPMGFLCQVETGDVLAKHAGVAVFCAVDGEATNEESENHVVLLKAAELEKSAPTPAGVPELPVSPITFLPAKLEIDERRALALGEKDPAFAQALERFQSKSKRVQEEGTAQKRGGLPVFLQGEVKLAGWKLAVQLDFDGLDVSAWPEAGLSGCLYVFVKDDERDAFAMWQYT